MRTVDFEYHLPPERIAQVPKEPRDHSRLFVYAVERAVREHCIFFEIEKYFKKGDVLVINDTKVFPARLKGIKKTKGKVEVFLLKEIKAGIWQVLVGGARRHVGDVIYFADDFSGTLLERQGNGETWLLQFACDTEIVWEMIEKYGDIPLPPYITDTSAKEQYQTVFARHKGSVAAPTAGLHFTDALLQTLEKKGVEIVHITLHVGLGTFATVTADEIIDHQMHAEWGEISQKAAQQINTAHARGNAVFAVGTTSVRTLETFKDDTGLVVPQVGWIDTFLYPGYEFKIVDGIITNFHLPKSTLLMLVAAFLAQKNTPEHGIAVLHDLYQEAIAKEYRFYSFGDAMLLLK